MHAEKKKEKHRQKQKKINSETDGTLQQNRELSRDLEDFSVIYICRFWSPQIPTLIKKNQLKLSYLMFTLINHNN